MSRDSEQDLAANDSATEGETTDFEELVARYIDRLNAGEVLDKGKLREEQPTLASEIWAHLELFRKVGNTTSTPTPLGVLGDYELLRQIGSGGMGIVYEAWQSSMDRRVALKILPVGIAVDPKRLTRFMREAKVAGKLHHANIVQVYGMGVDRDTPHYAMELVEGETLAEILAQLHAASKGSEAQRSRVISSVTRRFAREDSHEKTPAFQSAAVTETGNGFSNHNGGAAEVNLPFCLNLAQAFAGVADGLQHAHQRGVIHRDVKPSNLILDPAGRLRILDFGLAHLEDEESLTLSGDLVGTPSYMSPEQTLDAKGPIDARTDIFSVGATMYAMLARRSPFTGRTPQETLQQIVATDPEPLRQRHPLIPVDLETIVMKCLAKAPEDRYRSAEALAQDLRRFVRGSPIEARPQPAWERFSRNLWRHRRALGIVAAVVVLALIGLAVGNVLILNEQRKTEEARRSAERSAADAEWQAYLANLAAAATHLDAGNNGEALRLLERCPEARRGWEWRHLHARVTSNFRLSKVLPDEGAVAFSPDGRRLATFSVIGTLRLRDVATGKVLAKREAREEKNWPRFVRFVFGGRRILTRDQRGSRLWDVATLEPIDPRNVPQNSLLFSDDGRRAVTRDEGGCDVWEHNEEEWKQITRLHSLTGELGLSPDGKCVVERRGKVGALWNATTGDKIAELSGHPGVFRFAFSSDGRHFATGGWDYKARLWSVETGELRRVFRCRGRISSVALSRDGTYLAAGVAAGSVELWETEGAHRFATFGGYQRGPRWLSFSPNGELLAAACSAGLLTVERPLRIWDVSRLELAFTEHTDNVNSVAFSPDGTRIVSASHDHTVRIWDAANGFLIRTLTQHRGAVRSAVFSEAGDLIASSADDGTARLWNARSGASVATLRGHKEHVPDVAFSSDAKYLATAGVDDGTVCLWDTRTRTLLRKFESVFRRMAVTFSPDGKYLAMASSHGGIHVVSVETAEVVHELPGQYRGTRTVAYSPDSTTMASGSIEGIVLWDAQRGRRLRSLIGHQARVRSVAFSPDGTRLASGSDDMTVGVWDAKTGELLVRLRGHTEGVMSVAFSHDGKRLVSGADDGTIRIWESEIDTLRAIWDAAKRRRPIERLIGPLYEEHLLVEPVIAALEADDTIDAEIREAAVNLTRARGNPSPSQLNNASWNVVKGRDSTPEDYLLALRKAEAACELAPNSHNLNTLGVAQYRVGLHDAAIATLTDADRLNQQAEKPYNRAVDLLFIAMCRHELKQPEEAARLLSQCREIVKKEPDPELAAFLAEAEELTERSP